MQQSPTFSPEVWERAVRMVQALRGEYPAVRAAIEYVDPPQIGCVQQTLREWVKQSELDVGARVSTTTAEHVRVQELCRANEILYLASALFAHAGSTVA
jgi:transposase